MRAQSRAKRESTGRGKDVGGPGRSSTPLSGRPPRKYPHPDKTLVKRNVEDAKCDDELYGISAEVLEARGVTPKVAAVLAAEDIQQLTALDRPQLSEATRVMLTQVRRGP